MPSLELLAGTRSNACSGSDLAGFTFVKCDVIFCGYQYHSAILKAQIDHSASFAPAWEQTADELPGAPAQDHGSKGH